jgi:hypothetical protein
MSHSGNKKHTSASTDERPLKTDAGNDRWAHKTALRDPPLWMALMNVNPSCFQVNSFLSFLCFSEERRARKRISQRFKQAFSPLRPAKHWAGGGRLPMLAYFPKKPPGFAWVAVAV